MAIQKVFRFVALSALAAMFGCGTMANLDGRPLPTAGFEGRESTTPFGGVHRDIIWMRSGQAPANLKYAADLPLSLVGDLVTLPKAVIGTHSDKLLDDPGVVQAGSPYASQTRPAGGP